MIKEGQVPVRAFDGATQVTPHAHRGAPMALKVSVRWQRYLENGCELVVAAGVCTSDTCGARVVCRVSAEA